MNLRVLIKRIGIIILVFSCISQLKAVTIVVTNNNNAGAGSLRNAIGMSVSGDIIDMTGLTGTISLTTGEINITAGQDISIIGPGYNNLTIDCNNNSRAFQIYDADVAIDSLSIVNGNTTDFKGGGAIRAIFGSNLTISYCQIRDCTSIESLDSRGGAIDVLTYDPGANFTENGAVTVLIEHTQIENCQAYIGGGARFEGISVPFTIDINNCTFKDNATGPFGPLYSGNDGGAIEILANQNNDASSTNISITNSTFSGNSTQGITNGREGGALSLGTGTYNINNCTLSNNSSATGGGAIYFWGSNGSCTLTNTIVAQNTANTTGNDILGVILTGGYNLIGDITGATFTPTTGDVTGNTVTPVNALLFPLAVNGGVGETFAIDCFSPAIDAGGGSFLPLDQLGNSVVCTPDIGAFELQTSCCTSDTILICSGDSLFTDGNWENTAGIYGDTTLQIFNPNITVIPSTLCLTSTLVNLTGTPTGGTWTGTGVTGNSFDPAIAGIGNHLVTYTADSIHGDPAVTTTCFDTLSFIVIACTPPTASFVLSKSTICIGECITLTDQSTDVDSWLWSFNGGTPSSSTVQNPSEVCFNSPGVFNITLQTTNAYGNAISSLNLVVLPSPTITTIPNTTIELGESVYLLSSSSTGLYSWSPNAWLDCINCPNPITTPKETITYNVSLMGEHGCTASDQVTIFVKSDIIIYIPNTFTPNGDGLNDTFFAKMNVDFKDDFELLIFNRWGNLLFESHNILNGWDGTYKNTLVPSGTYVYAISYYDRTKTGTIKKLGMINLLK